eukprot:323604-Rhodomonas_salina.1
MTVLTVHPPLTPEIAAECLIPGSSLAPTPPSPRTMKMSIGVLLQWRFPELMVGMRPDCVSALLGLLVPLAIRQ